MWYLIGFMCILLYFAINQILFTILQSKKKNAKEQLEDIQEEIYQIDKYKLTSFLRQKNYLALVYFLFILIYPTGLVYIYFTFDNNNNRTQILYSLLFIISLPIL